MLTSSLFINTLIWLIKITLPATFTLAATAKLRDPKRAREALLGFGIPEPATRPTLTALILVELTIAVLLAYPPTQPTGAIGATAILAVFTLAIVWQLLRGRRPACACFGALTDSAISWKSVGRNVLLIALAAVLVAFPQTRVAPTPIDTGTLLTSMALAWMGISLVWLLLLTRQNGRLLLRLQQLEERAEGAIPAAAHPQPLRVGAAVPPLRLSDARGRSFDLSRFRGRPVLLLFVDSACNHCQSLLARLRNAELGNTATALVVISDRALLQHDLPTEMTMLIDAGWSNMTLFGLRGTPAAVALEADGTLAQLAVHGTSAVSAALDQLTIQEVRHEFAPV
jgi:methylamine utilization protein MauE